MSQNEVALITGATRGIGRAVALRLAELGFRTALVSRNKAELAKVVEQCKLLGSDSRGYVCDLEDLTSLDQLVAGIVTDFGRLDVVVSAAGICEEAPVEEIAFDSVERSMRINFLSPSKLILAAVPYIVEATKANRRAAIIGIGSVAAFGAYRTGAAYCPSKAALHSFFDALQQNLCDKNVIVSIIHPGVVDTDMHSQDKRFEKDAMLQADDIADTIEDIFRSSSRACPFSITLRPRSNPRRKRSDL